jgi:hypothetical protein
MISRLEGGTASWKVEHLIAYEDVLGLTPGTLRAPAHKIFSLFGRADSDALIRRVYSDEDEQSAADLVDCVIGGDPIGGGDWDFLTGYLLTTGRKLGARTWATLCARLLLEICAAQGPDQDIRVHALIRILRIKAAAEQAHEAAIAAMTQPGNPGSFLPLKAYQSAPHLAPSQWVVRALLDPPDRWLLRELFTSVGALVAAGAWIPASKELRALRVVSADATLDDDMEFEVRRVSLQLLRDLYDEPAQLVRALPSGASPELIYLAKPAVMQDRQVRRYEELCARLAADIQEEGVRWQTKWSGNEDSALSHILNESLFGRSDGQRSAYTSLLTNSGYVRSLRRVLAAEFIRDRIFDDATVTRALIRLFGKVAHGDADGRAILDLIAGERIDLDTRIQACWALVNAAPRLPRRIVQQALDTCRGRSFGSQSGTALRAAIAACGRAGSVQALRDLTDDPTLDGPARAECRWWLSIPAYVISSMAHVPSNID